MKAGWIRRRAGNKGYRCRRRPRLSCFHVRSPRCRASGKGAAGRNGKPAGPMQPPLDDPQGDAKQGAERNTALSERILFRSKVVKHEKNLEHGLFGLQRCRTGNPDCHPGRSEAEIRGPGCRALCRVAPAVLGPGFPARGGDRLGPGRQIRAGIQFERAPPRPFARHCSFRSVPGPGRPVAGGARPSRA